MSGRNFPGCEPALEFGLYALAQLDCSDAAGQPVQMGDEKVHGLCDRFSIRSQLLGGSYCLYPIHWGEGDLSSVSLNLRIAIRCGGFRFPFRAKPKLDSLVSGEAGDVPVTIPKGPFAVLDREKDRASARHTFSLQSIVQKR
jgi:hypothetical protein